jgi:hypothetical protein
MPYRTQNKLSIAVALAGLLAVSWGSTGCLVSFSPSKDTNANNTNGNHNENGNENDNRNTNTNANHNNATCGNGVVEEGESCDATDLGGQSCATLFGLLDGTLGCRNDCTFDTADCHMCGNGALEGPESCDGALLGGQTCATRTGYDGGVLACAADCRAFDPTGCWTCGDGTCETAKGETVDDCALDCACTPAAERACDCPGWETGSQTCTAQGQWAACVCSQCAAATHDEDGDGVLDECDNCPSMANANQNDSDGDMLGDACEDPADEDLLSHGVLFDPFLDPAAFSSWVLGDHATWQTDRLQVDKLGCPGECSSNTVWDVVLNPDFAIASTFFIQDVNAEGWIGLVFGHQDPTVVEPHWATCVLHRENGTTALELWTYTGGATVDIQYGVANVEPSNAPLSTIRHLRVFADGQQAYCLFENELGDTASLDITAHISASFLSGRSGMRVYSLDGVFQHFVIYE